MRGATAPARRKVPGPTEASRGCWRPVQVFSLASPGGSGGVLPLWLPCFEWTWTSWNGMTATQLRTFFSWTCDFSDSRVRFGFLQTSERKRNSNKSMAANRENEDMSREPGGAAAGGEGRWPADNKQHKTDTNSIQTWLQDKFTICVCKYLLDNFSYISLSVVPLNNHPTCNVMY